MNKNLQKSNEPNTSTAVPVCQVLTKNQRKRLRQKRNKTANQNMGVNSSKPDEENSDSKVEEKCASNNSDDCDNSDKSVFISENVEGHTDYEKNLQTSTYTKIEKKVSKKSAKKFCDVNIKSSKSLLEGNLGKVDTGDLDTTGVNTLLSTIDEPKDGSTCQEPGNEDVTTIDETTNVTSETYQQSTQQIDALSEDLHTVLPDLTSEESRKDASKTDMKAQIRNDLKFFDELLASKFNTSRNVSHIEEISTEPLESCELDRKEYQVEFPGVKTTITKKSSSASSSSTSIKKSRSLDDDDTVQITEVLSSDEAVESTEMNVALISDTEDDWELTTELRIPENSTLKFNSIGLFLDNESTDLSTKEVTPRRQRLQNINYSSSSDDENLKEYLQECISVNNELRSDPKEILSPEKILERRAKKRAMLESYFVPSFQNPRFLDIIQEEGSSANSSVLDLSEKKMKNSGSEIPYMDDLDDDVFLENEEVVNKKQQKRYFDRMPKLQLVETQLNDQKVDEFSSSNWSRDFIKSPEIEVVFIEDDEVGSGSSDEEFSNRSEAQEADDECSREDLLDEKCTSFMEGGALDYDIDLPFDSITVNNSKMGKEGYFEPSNNLKSHEVEIPQHVDRRLQKELQEARFVQEASAIIKDIENLSENEFPADTIPESKEAQRKLNISNEITNSTEAENIEKLTTSIENITWNFKTDCLTAQAKKKIPEEAEKANIIETLKKKPELSKTQSDLETAEWVKKPKPVTQENLLNSTTPISEEMHYGSIGYSNEESVLKTTENIVKSKSMIDTQEKLPKDEEKIDVAEFLNSVESKPTVEPQETITKGIDKDACNFASECSTMETVTETTEMFETKENKIEFQVLKPEFMTDEIEVKKPAKKNNKGNKNIKIELNNSKPDPKSKVIVDNCVKNLGNPKEKTSNEHIIKIDLENTKANKPNSPKKGKGKNQEILSSNIDEATVIIDNEIENLENIATATIQTPKERLIPIKVEENGSKMSRKQRRKIKFLQDNLKSMQKEVVIVDNCVKNLGNAPIKDVTSAVANQPKEHIVEILVNSKDEVKRSSNTEITKSSEISKKQTTSVSKDPNDSIGQLFPSFCGLSKTSKDQPTTPSMEHIIEMKPSLESSEESKGSVVSSMKILEHKTIESSQRKEETVILNQASNNPDAIEIKVGHFQPQKHIIKVNLENSSTEKTSEKTEEKNQNLTTKESKPRTSSEHIIKVDLENSSTEPKLSPSEHIIKIDAEKPKLKPPTPETNPITKESSSSVHIIKVENEKIAGSNQRSENQYQKQTVPNTHNVPIIIETSDSKKEAIPEEANKQECLQTHEIKMEKSIIKNEKCESKITKEITSSSPDILKHSKFLSSNEPIKTFADLRKLKTERSNSAEIFTKTLLKLIAETKNDPLNGPKLQDFLKETHMYPLPQEIHDTIQELMESIPNQKPDEKPQSYASFDKEFELLFKSLNEITGSQSRPSSSNSFGSSSTTTTVKHIPSSSSLTDIHALLTDEPKTLRELSLDIIQNLPYGSAVLEELAKVSETINESLNPSYHPDSTDSNMPNSVADMTKLNWVGLPTQDPKLLLCLSPSQQNIQKDNADQLLDLHQKFSERRSYHDEIRPSQKSRLLKIICEERGEPTETRSCCEDVSHTREELPSYYSDSEEVQYYFNQSPPEVPKRLYRRKPKSEIVEEKIFPQGTYKQPTYISNLQSYQQKSIPKAPMEHDVTDHIDQQRLKAQQLSEWLHLARKQDPPKRRNSLPQELHEKQLKYILQKEREIEREIQDLEKEKNRLSFHDIESKSRPLSMPVSCMVYGDFFRKQMYDEYLNKIAERENRKNNKLIKISSTSEIPKVEPKANFVEMVNIEHEFMSKVREKKQKLGEVQSEDESSSSKPEIPKHLQEFIQFRETTNEDESTTSRTVSKTVETKEVKIIQNELLGIWSPGQRDKSESSETKIKSSASGPLTAPPPPPPPSSLALTKNTPTTSSSEVIWAPKSAGTSPVLERKEFRPVRFESPKFDRKVRQGSDVSKPKTPETSTPPWKQEQSAATTITSTLERRLTSSQSAPVSGFNSIQNSNHQTPSARLPRAQNPTITLLQKAREGQLPRGASYIEDTRKTPPRSGDDRPPIIGQHEILYSVKNEYTSQPETNGTPKKMVDLGSRKFEGIGPTTRDGMPIVLRSEVKENNQAKWYKRMYDTLHKTKDDEYVTIRYKQRKGRYPYNTSGSGYLSEPEANAGSYVYDSDTATNVSSYATLDRRRPQPSRGKENNYTTSTMPRNRSLSTSSATTRYGSDPYKNQPGRIENYVPGHSSISEKEAKEHLEQQKLVPHHSKSYMAQALKESGYESDSTLVFKRREDSLSQQSQLSPQEHKAAYKTIQKGGEVPLHGLRKPAPERPKEESSDIEYFPISPTLTRIRVHKNINPITEYQCYPIHSIKYNTNPFKQQSKIPQATRTPSPNQAPTIPPPPYRRSSRYSTTLRMVSTMSVKDTEKSQTKRKVTKVTKIQPSSSGTRITSTITNTFPTRAIRTRTDITRNASPDMFIRPRSVSKSPSARNTPESTFGAAKKKVELGLKKSSRNKLNPASELKSPNEVQKVVQQSKSGTIVKKGSVVYASSRHQAKQPPKVLNTTVSITPQGRDLLKDQKSKAKIVKPIKPLQKSIKVESKPDNKSNKIVRKVKKPIAKGKENMIKCVGKAAGTELVKKLQKPQFKGYGDVCKDELQGNDGFFSKLLMRDMSGRELVSTKAVRSNSVLERAKKFQNYVVIDGNKKHSLPKYLEHKKPVSDSKFRDKFSTLPMIGDNSYGGYGVFEKIRHFDSLSQIDDDERLSVSLRDFSPDLYYGRSSSEPPLKTLENEFRPTREIRSPRSITPTLSIYRSPSKRKIVNKKAGERQSPPPPKTIRARSAGDAEAVKRDIRRSLIKENTMSISTSSLALSNISDHSEYSSYINELLHSNKKSERFKDLKNFYLALERKGQLEKNTISNSDLRYLSTRREDETIIDYDLWKKVRAYERAELELNKLYEKLKYDEKEKGFLFQPSDCNLKKWQRDKDRTLRIRDSSIKDLKEHFAKIKQQLNEAALRKQVKEKDFYKPLWRGSSVLNLAKHMTERSKSEPRQQLSLPCSNKKYRDLAGIGTKIWSSLSMEQVNTIKNQLSEIYNINPPSEGDCVIEVPKDKMWKEEINSQLHVRSNSLSAANPKNGKSTGKAGSISTIDNVSKFQLSESEKKRLSLTLSKEVLDRLNKNRFKEQITPKETRGAIAAANAKLPTEPRVCYSLETSVEGGDGMDKSDYILVLAPKNETNLDKTAEVLNEWAQKKTPVPKTPIPASETESASSDTSTKTVINATDLQKKVNFFETTSKAVVPKTNLESKLSTSVTDLKELFGESKSKSISYSISPVQTSQESIYTPRSRSYSPDPEKYYRAFLAIAKSGDVSKLRNRFESLDHIGYHFGARPVRYQSDPELTRLFLSDKNYSDLDKIIIRGQEYGDVDWLRHKYEQRGSRGRSRSRRSPIPKHSFKRIEDRYMPHINVISKLAKLKTTTPRSTPSPVCLTPPGEVHKLRKKFDSPDMSLMGQMFTSSPNVNELKDIAPYLAGSWIAHKYPRRQDNSRSLSSPECLVTENNGTYPPRRVLSQKSSKPRPKSASPPRTLKRQPMSILKKSSQNLFDDQKFDPKIHRPISRYQPSPPPVRKEKGTTYRSWVSPEPPSTKPTVTFKEPEYLTAPTPPPKGPHHFSFGPESPRRYVENEVTIHYRSPVRHEIKDVIAEEELARRQAEAMRRIYQEERRRKYLQELQDMNSRRHTDNFTPSQKSPIPLNRYDDFDDMVISKSYNSLKSPGYREARPQEKRLIAKALFNFVGQTPRELTFKKGDIIYIRRQIDKNWYEGEHNAMIGLFPFNYVEIVPFDGQNKVLAKKPSEGEARAKFNFIAQTHLELSLAKGEHVVLTRRVDDNWFEGRIGNKKGIFPVSYVEVLLYPGEQQESVKPVASPASHSMLLNGSSGGKQSMGSHHYQPSFPAPGSAASPQSAVNYHHAKPVNVTPVSREFNSANSIPRPQQSSKNSVNVNQTLHIDTQSDPVPYRAMYKYRPQNEDELELLEGDTVYVLEKCDDGWYVGSSQRTGAFGTFPGNYVERIKN